MAGLLIGLMATLQLNGLDWEAHTTVLRYLPNYYLLFGVELVVTGRMLLGFIFKTQHMNCL